MVSGLHDAIDPCAEAIAHGTHRVEALAKRLLYGEAIDDPWLDEKLADIDGEPLGVPIAAVPEEWRRAFLHVGIPMIADASAEAHWGRTITVGDDDLPNQKDDQLILPADPDLLELCTGVDLKPVRRWVSGHFGPRLQAAPGLGFFLWTSHAIVVSTHGISLAGFIHGPKVGERHVLALEPGGVSVVRLR